MTRAAKKPGKQSKPRRFARVFVSLADWAVEALHDIMVAERRRTVADTARAVLEKALEERGKKNT